VLGCSWCRIAAKPGLPSERKEKFRLIEPLDVGFVKERVVSETPQSG
jgi:hypothetical protein